MKEHLKTGLILQYLCWPQLLVSIVYNFVSPYLEQGDISNTLKAIEEVLKDHIWIIDYFKYSKDKVP